MGDFNINENVWVRLTDVGREYHRSRHEEYYGVMPYHAPEEDSNGWSKWQLWHLMKTFGESISLAGFPPFETEIRFSKPS